MHLIACSPGAPIHSVFLSRSPQSPPSRPPSIIARGWQAYLVNRGNTLAAYLASKTPTRRDGFIYLIYEQYTFASTHLHSDTFFASSPLPVFSFSHSLSLFLYHSCISLSPATVVFLLLSHSLTIFFLPLSTLSLFPSFFSFSFSYVSLSPATVIFLSLSHLLSFFSLSPSLSFSLFLYQQTPLNERNL